MHSSKCLEPEYTLNRKLCMNVVSWLELQTTHRRANRLQCFMVSSMSTNRDVVSMAHVQSKVDTFVLWFSVWYTYEAQHDSGFLTKETYLALSHTVTTFVIIINNLLGNGVMQNVITGKFQTDQPDSRFGHNR